MEAVVVKKGKDPADFAYEMYERFRPIILRASAVGAVDAVDDRKLADNEESMSRAPDLHRRA
jgi:hypothetical protein